MSMRIYACGGAGSNVVKNITDLDIDVCYVDTSKSNLKKVPDENIFLVDGLDGAGKNRVVTYEGFKDVVEEVMIRFKPSETLNVVVSSLSGGSGAIINAAITKELLLQDKPVVVIVMDSVASGIEISNTMKSLKTFKAVSTQTKKSVALRYVENNSRGEADKQVISFINLLSLLIDKNNTEEFDSSDLSNFLQHQNVTEYAPDVSILTTTDNSLITPDKDTVVVGTILLTSDKESQIQEVLPEYLATCIVTDPDFNNEDIRIDTVLGALNPLVSRLEKKLNDMADNRRINKFRDVNVSDANEDGIVV